MRDEALNLRRQIVTATTVPAIGEAARIGAFRSLPDEAFSDPESFKVFGDLALSEEMWSPPFADEGCSESFRNPGAGSWSASP
jgi:hypothetical protein